MGIALEHFRKKREARGEAKGKKMMAKKVRDFAISNGETISRTELLKLLDDLDQEEGESHA